MHNPWSSFAASGPLRRLRATLLGALALSAVLTSQAYAAEFAEITQQERELTSVPGQPNASAVVLFKKGKFSVTEDVRTGRDLYDYTVRVRRKILTEEGKKYGEITLVHGKLSRLQKLEGRTVLPDGRSIPLPKDATFKRRASMSEKIFVTSVAFPAVEVGAILDYSYQVRLESILLVEPWIFQEEVPTLVSEILYEIPKTLGVNYWLQDPMRTGVSGEIKETPEGWEIFGQGKNLPALLSEPYGPPLVELAGYVMILPAVVEGDFGVWRDLLKTWASTCELYAPGYEKAVRKSGAASRKAKEIAAKLPGAGGRERAEAVYRFVRDEIETVAWTGVDLPEDSTVDSVLAAGRGGSVEKALLLQTMLQAVDVPGRPVWVAERHGGMPNLAYPNPGWFDRVIFAADVDGRRLFLDPSDRRLAFGRLDPTLEGMPALLFSRTPETITLPVTSFEENQRQAKIELDVDGEGRLSGRGSLAFIGHHGWDRLHRGEDAETTVKAWTEWLGNSYTDFAIDGVKVSEAVEERKVEVTWTMAQRAEEVLGDEVTFLPSRPLGPTQQIFQLPPSQRLSAVLLLFGDRDEVELTVRWPEGWRPEALPSETQAVGPAGSLTASIQVDEPGRRLTYRRRFDIKEREYGKELYGAIRSLYNQTEKHDAQPIVLVRR